MRLFVALSLPEQTRQRLAQISRGIPGARWVEEQNLHLTLRFLGEVERHQAHDIDDALSRVDAQAFPLSLAGVGEFGEDRKPRSIWVGVDNNPALLQLQARIEQAVQRAGLPPERRKFKPHVTLARFRSHPGDKLGSYVVEHALLRMPAFSVEDFVLYSSHLSSSGPIYTPEAVYPLTAQAAAAL